MNESATIDPQNVRPPIDLESVSTRCGGDGQFAMAIIERFGAQAPNEMGRIEQAVGSGDAEALRRAAHTLKSMSAYVTAETAADWCKQLEELGRANQVDQAALLVARLKVEIDRVCSWIARNCNAAQSLCT